MARRTKSQARRNHGGGGGSLPGWAWLILGVVLAIGTILAAPRFLQRQGEDSFFRPRANPDAQPVTARPDADAEGVATEGELAKQDVPATTAPNAPAAEQAPQYDFYDLLPSEEVAMTDAQLAAATRAEAERTRREQQRLAQQQAARGDGMQPQPLPEAPASPATPVPPIATTDASSSASATAGSTSTAATPPTPASGNQTPYILQAGAFGASGDAEAVKARIALLGLNARVESAQISGKTVYRVRMGPYGSASELATAKGKLSNGGLPALAIKAR